MLDNDKKAHRKYVKAIALTKKYTREKNFEAETLLDKSYRLNGTFTRALSWRAYVLLIRFQEAWGDHPDDDLKAAMVLARRAVEIDAKDYSNQWTWGIVCHAAAGSALEEGDEREARRLTAEGDAAMKSALSANPNDADLLVMHADILVRRQNAEEAIDQIYRAIQLKCPPWYLWSLGAAQFHARRYSDAVRTLIRIREPQPRVHLLLAAAYVRLGAVAGPAVEPVLAQLARSELAAFRQEIPNWSLGHETKQLFAVAQHPSSHEHWLKSLRLAGAE